MLQSFIKCNLKINTKKGCCFHNALALRICGFIKFAGKPVKLTVIKTEGSPPNVVS